MSGSTNNGLRISARKTTTNNVAPIHPSGDSMLDRFDKQRLAAYMQVILLALAASVIYLSLIHI